MQSDFDVLTVVTHTSDKLVLERERWGALGLALLQLIFIVVWYLMLENPAEQNFFLTLLICIAPILIFSRSIYQSLIMVFHGGTYYFSKSEQLIRRNKKLWLKFVDIQFIQISCFYDRNDNINSYQLALTDKKGKNYLLDESSHFQQISHMADLIAFITEVEVVKKY